ncbi:MAG: LysM peptidoglycan-binding domain-containing protein [Vicinamibacterales bacterium]
MPSKRIPIALALATTLVAGCVSGAGLKTAAIVPQAPLPVAITAAAPTPPPDPIDILIATSDRLFANAQAQLTLGHLDGARTDFDAALDTLLESRDGARADARLREHFDRLVDRISALEQSALAKGDGFTETVTEPASIDALLAIETFDTTAPTMLTAETVAADLETTDHDIPIPTNDRVLRYVELFQGRLREFLTEGLSRGAQYLPMIQATFRAEGLPLDLAYVPLIESAFKPSALSRTKARGVWQFMKGTALENGLKADWYLDERADPEKATVAAAKYLKTLYGMFEDWHLALASYNGGPGRMQRALKRSRQNDFWLLTGSKKYLPRETRDYVPMILAAVLIAKNPAQYGFDITPAVTTAMETVTVPGALDLRRVAEWAGVPVDDIQTLNPEFRRWTTPVKAGNYVLKVPSGTADRVRDGLSGAASHQLNALQWHTVKKGETLATISKKLRVNRTDLAEANYLKATSRVKLGQKLVIPRMPSAALLARASSAETAAIEAEDAIAETIAVDEPTGVRKVYRVRPGDTLYAIAKRNGATIEQLKAWNNIRGSKLNIGDRIVIQSPKTANAQNNNQ